jgi:hypothetical protein
MKKAYLSQYFEAVAAKRLTEVEVNKKISNQHEFNGSLALKRILGTNDEGQKIFFQGRFIWMGEKEDVITADGKLSWYDSRYESTTRAPEWRLYFPTTDVTQLAQAGDLLIIGKRTDNSLYCIIVSAGSTIENQLLWLFDVPVQTGKEFVYQDIRQTSDKEIDFAVRFILEELGIEVQDPEVDYLDSIVSGLQGKMPTTRAFSALTRQTLKGVNPLDNPDEALTAWMTLEEKLFRRMERHEVEKRLRQGFVTQDGTDVDGFLKFSLSVQNTRKSRAGLALENHLEEIFRAHKIRYVRAKETENKAKPDFLFPGIEQYRLSSFPNSLITMLGVKTTCKERWRQVLSEAARVREKHLLTLEPGISENQTNEMKAHNLQLVLPSSLHNTYSDNQKKWLLDLKGFIEDVLNKQNNSELESWQLL